MHVHEWKSASCFQNINVCFFFLNSIITGRINSCILYMYVYQCCKHTCTNFFICSASYCAASVIMWCFMKKRHNTPLEHIKLMCMVCMKMVHMSSISGYDVAVLKERQNQTISTQDNVAYAGTIYLSSKIWLMNKYTYDMMIIM